jgi:hypothetical protein
MPYFGTPLFAAPGLGILPSATILGLGLWWLRAIEARARRVAEGYSSETEATVDEQFVRERATNADNFGPAELLHGQRSEHLRQHRTSGQEYCGQVDHDDCIPALDWEFVHWRNTLDARVVDEHIDASEFARRMLDQPRGVGWLGEIAKATARRGPRQCPYAASRALRPRRSR